MPTVSRFVTIAAARPSRLAGIARPARSPSATPRPATRRADCSDAGRRAALAAGGADQTADPALLADERQSVDPGVMRVVLHPADNGSAAARQDDNPTVRLLAN